MICADDYAERACNVFHIHILTFHHILKNYCHVSFILSFIVKSLKSGEQFLRTVHFNSGRTFFITYLNLSYVHWCEDVRSGTRVTDSCDLPYRCWGLNPGPLEEQPVLLTAELSLQSLYLDLL